MSKIGRKHIEYDKNIGHILDQSNIKQTLNVIIENISDEICKCRGVKKREAVVTMWNPL